MEIKRKDFKKKPSQNFHDFEYKLVIIRGRRDTVQYCTHTPDQILTFYKRVDEVILVLEISCNSKYSTRSISCIFLLYVKWFFPSSSCSST